MYWKYTCTTCALSLFHVCFIFAPISHSFLRQHVNITKVCQKMKNSSRNTANVRQNVFSFRRPLRFASHPPPAWAGALPRKPRCGLSLNRNYRLTLPRLPCPPFSLWICHWVEQAVFKWMSSYIVSYLQPGIVEASTERRNWTELNWTPPLVSSVQLRRFVHALKGHCVLIGQ